MTRPALVFDASDDCPNLRARDFATVGQTCERREIEHVNLRCWVLFEYVQRELDIRWRVPCREWVIVDKKPSVFAFANRLPAQTQAVQVGMVCRQQFEIPCGQGLVAIAIVDCPASTILTGERQLF